MISTPTPDYWNHTRDVQNEIILRHENLTKAIETVSCNFPPCPREMIFWIGVGIGLLVAVSGVLIAYMIWQVEKRAKEKEDEE